MSRHLIVVGLLAALSSSCARNPRSQPSATGVAQTGTAHDMASHDHGSGAEKSKIQTAFLFPEGDDRGWSTVENGVQHAGGPDVPLAKLPPDVRTELRRQLALTMDVVRKYPTVKDAEAAGYRRAGPFMPGLGTHYVGGRTARTTAMTDEEILHPSSLIYDGNKQDSPIAGMMYMAGTTAPALKEPLGFAGPNDHWHYHTGICLVPGPNGAREALGADGSITKENCATRKGQWVAATNYLLHVWTAPGYSNPLGVFAHVNPGVTCGDGTYYTDAHDITNTCRVP
jgi:hypothetical protein